MMVNPWRTRAQKAFTLVLSSAKPTRPAMASAVSTNSRKRGCEAKKLRSKAPSLEKSGGLGKTPWLKAKARMNSAHRGVEAELHEERGGDRRVGRVRDRGLDQEELDDVAAARRHDVVEAVGGDVGAPDPLELDLLGRVGGAQHVEEGARADRQVGAEAQQPERQRAPADVGEVAEELPDRVEEVAEAGDDQSGAHPREGTSPTAARTASSASEAAMRSAGGISMSAR